jgi:hypothetical protein
MEIYNKLPDDIKDIILNKYLIYPQKKELLNDIENFKKYKDGIYKIYEHLGYEYNNDYTNDFNIYAVIDNDLMAFWNDDMAYIYGITDKNYAKMFRLLAFKIKNDSYGSKAQHNFHMNINISSKTKINRYLAGLTMEERAKFVSILKDK